MLADYVEIRVPQSLYCYIVHTTGGDIIRIGKYGILWAVIKQHLICYTRWRLELDTIQPDKEEPTLKVELLRKNGAQVPNQDVTLNTASRRYLSVKGCRIVVRLLISEFQKTFLDYMSGASMANPQLNIKDAINVFCDDYGLDFLSSYEMLKKRWYRYRTKEYHQHNTLLNL